MAKQGDRYHFHSRWITEGRAGLYPGTFPPDSMVKETAQRDRLSESKSVYVFMAVVTSVDAAQQALVAAKG